MRYNPIKAGSYIELPNEIVRKRAVLNIQNLDNKCFIWSVLAHLNPVDYGKHPHRVSNYLPFEDQLNIEGIEMPMRLVDIKKFETQNARISINVFGISVTYTSFGPKYEIIGPLYHTSNRKDNHINLLLIDNEEGTTHYTLIQNMSRLISSQINSRKCSLYLCDGCLIYFPDKAKLDRHQVYDCNHIYTKLPSNTEKRTDYLGSEIPVNLLKFDNYQKQLKVPFCIYADFEAILQPMDYVVPNPDNSYTVPIVKHIPYSFAYLIKCSYNDELTKFRTYRGADCAKQFIETVTNDVKEIAINYLKKMLPMTPLNEMQQREYDLTTVCHICKQPFPTDSENDNLKKVRDHCHLTSFYRGAAHSICNLNYKIPKFIPIFFHNLSNYDTHLFIRELGATQDQINVIAQNKEKYICFTRRIPLDFDSYINLKFVDSFRFMASSLEKLAKNLDDSQCKEVRKYFQDETKFQLVRQKGVFPYNYVNSLSKLNDCNLPSYEDFYDKLRNTNISMEDYNRAQNVWHQFGCETLGAYSDLYLKVDVLLLADIFENFRDVCIRIYQLDPAHYPTAPSLSWDAMLKVTQIELELLTDIDMFHFLKRGIRGGISVCNKRRALANNTYLETYDPAKPNCFISYLDATNLYGAAMSLYLPQADFRWLTNEEIQNLNIAEIPPNGNFGYIFEVDLEYSKDLHDSHNDLPFCPESIVSPASKLNTRKLIPNLFDKTKYVIHYRNLQQALENGLKLTRIHRVISFRQSCWLKTYIDLNTENRNKSKNKFEKDFFKLMNNSVFGKTMENVDKRVDVRLITHWESRGKKLGAESLIAKPYFKNCSIFSESLIAIQMQRTKVVYDKPIYVGFSVLDLSKHIMYNFFYNYVKKYYGDKATLCYSDTDSLILQVYTDNIYTDMALNLEWFDTSNYSENNIYKVPVTLPRLGCMKDEYADQVISEFVGTGAKAYAIKCDNQHLTTKAKGVPNHISSKFTLENYRDAVSVPNYKLIVNFQSFRSRLHEIFTEMCNKVGLSYFDDKRSLITGSYNTHAWGHKNIFKSSDT